METNQGNGGPGAAGGDQVVKFWIGTQPRPEDRFQILVSPVDAEKIRSLPRGSSKWIAEVEDRKSGLAAFIRRADCGGGCFCALEFDGDEGELIMAEKFKVGDRVRVRDHNPINPGKCGVVRSKRGRGDLNGLISVDYDDGGMEEISPFWLEEDHRDPAASGTRDWLGSEARKIVNPFERLAFVKGARAMYERIQADDREAAAAAVQANGGAAAKDQYHPPKIKGGL